MREGQEAASPFAGGAGTAHAAGSFARRAEELVRAGAGSSLAWEGASIATLFQPIYCARRGTCLGFEALADVRDAQGGAVRCEEFFAREHAGGRALLDWACRALHLRNYATVDPGDRTLFINVHPEAAVRDVRRGRDLAELIRYYGLAPRRVCIEILEAPCSDEDLLREAVEAYRDLGASIAMDDFGIEASDYDRVRRLRPDVVKIDKSVLGDMHGRDSAARTLPAMVGALHEAGARVAVEGIDSRAMAMAALDARADYLQGYFFASPERGLEAEILGRELLDRLLHPATAQAA